jgi:ubiquinone/menaquinone biosynthesis C-methylase UbiE
MPIEKDPEGTETSQISEIANFNGKRVLEIGCGDGRLTWRYASSASSIVGIDPDAVALIEANAACSNDLRQKITFIRTTSLNLPFRKNLFDIAILAWAL